MAIIENCPICGRRLIKDESSEFITLAICTACDKAWDDMVIEKGKELPASMLWS